MDPLVDARSAAEAVQQVRTYWPDSGAALEGAEQRAAAAELTRSPER